MHFILILQCIRAQAAFKCIVVPSRSSKLNLCVVALEYFTRDWCRRGVFCCLKDVEGELDAGIALEYYRVPGSNQCM